MILFFNKASCLFIPMHSKYKFMDPLMFNLGGLIITNQEQVVSAVAGLKCTPPVYTLLISRHLLEVDHSFTLQLSPGYGREKRKRYLADTADFESSSLQVSYSPAQKRHWYDDTNKKVLTSSVHGLPLHTQNQVWQLVSHSAKILDKCLLWIQCFVWLKGFKMVVLKMLTMLSVNKGFQVQHYYLSLPSYGVEL